MSFSRAGVGNRRSRNCVLPDRDSFEERVRRYTPLVKRIAYSITSSIDDSHDVTQFVFMQMYVKSPQFDNRRGIERWLYIVTRNKALEICHRRRREDLLVALESSNSSQTDLEEIVLQNERSRHVRTAIALLPDRQRRLIELRHLMSFPPAEIAEHLELSTEHVKREVERATFRLRAEMRRCNLDHDVP